MSLTEPQLLANIYHGLAAPPLGYHQPRPPRRIPFAMTPPISLVKPAHSSLPLNSLLPTQIPLVAPYSPHVSSPLGLQLDVPAANNADSLTRERKGKMPALGHLLSVEQGKVLSLAADDRHVYAGCQSEDNEITVSYHIESGCSPR